MSTAGSSTRRGSCRVTSIRCVPAVASAGTVTLSVTLVAVDAAGRLDAVDREPAATQDRRPAGRDLADRRARRGRALAVVTEMSKLGLEPGATAIAGKGVRQRDGRCGRRGRGRREQRQAQHRRHEAEPRRARSNVPTDHDTEPPPRAIHRRRSWGLPRSRARGHPRARTAASLTPRMVEESTKTSVEETSIIARRPHRSPTDHPGPSAFDESPIFGDT